VEEPLGAMASGKSFRINIHSDSILISTSAAKLTNDKFREDRRNQFRFNALAGVSASNRCESLPVALPVALRWY
jgi:hypothetical protein